MVSVLKNLIPLILLIQDGNFVSGQKLAATLGVSRATISAWISELTNYGLDIHKVTGKGYRLSHSLELIDQKHLIGKIQPDVRAGLSVIDILAESESTNKEALNSVYELNEWKLFASEFQHAGRGRRGREWLSPFGANLLFSLGHKAIWKAEVLYLASIIGGLAVVAVLRDLIGDTVTLKWPNDVYIGNEKVCGILCELLGSPQDEALLVIGVGINVHFKPLNTAIPATKIDDHVTEPVNKTELLAALTNAIVSRLNAANRYGIDNIIEQWQQVDYLKDRQVNISQGANLFTGKASGIDRSGQLVVQMSDGSTKFFNGGEVTVRW